MNQNVALKETLRDYDRLRNEALRLKDARLEEVYLKIPRIAEIDAAITSTGISITKLVLDKKQDTQDKTIRLDALMRRNNELSEEKTSLLKMNKYPPDYFENIYHCKKCSDSGFIGGERCSCLKQRLMQRYYAMSNLANAIEYENFDSFDYRYYSKEKIEGENKSPYERIKDIHQASVRFVESFGKEFINLLFYGKTGLGKTFMCNCIAKDLLDRGYTVLYLTSSQLFKAVNDYHFNRDESEGVNSSDFIDFIYDVDLLIVDDLGTEFSTIVTTSEFFNFINRRLLERRPTIISTNLNLKELGAIYSDRIISRLLGQYMTFVFLGSDIRIQKKYG